MISNDLLFRYNDIVKKHELFAEALRARRDDKSISEYSSTFKDTVNKLLDGAFDDNYDVFGNISMIEGYFFNNPSEVDDIEDEINEAEIRLSLIEQTIDEIDRLMENAYYANIQQEENE